MKTTILVFCAVICITSSQAADAPLLTAHGSVDFQSSPAVLHDGYLTMSGVHAWEYHWMLGYAHLTSVEDQVDSILSKIEKNIGAEHMDISNIVQLEVSVGDIKDWGAVERILKMKLKNCVLPALTVTQTKFVQEGVKVQVNLIAVQRTRRLRGMPSKMATSPDSGSGWGTGIVMDKKNGIAHLNGMIVPDSPSYNTNDQATSYGDQVIAIMSLIESKLKTVGMDRQNLVMVSIATEVGAAVSDSSGTVTRNTSKYLKDLIDLNNKYNDWMTGVKILPSMVAYGVDAFPGSEKKGLQIMVTAVAAHNKMILPKLQVSGPVAVGEAMALPYSSVTGTTSPADAVWVSGFGYYGASKDMEVAAKDVMGQVEHTLTEASLGGLGAVVGADVMVAAAGREQLDALVKVYNQAFAAANVKPPTMSIREVAEIGGESPLEITVTATSASKRGIVG